MCGFGAKNEERESKTARKMGRVQEPSSFIFWFSFHFWRAEPAFLFVPRSFFALGPHGNACYACWAFVSLRRRCHLTSVSGVCEAAPISLFWAPNGLNELPEVHFEFPFILIGKSTMTFSTPIMARTQIRVHRWGPRTGILALFRRRD